MTSSKITPVGSVFQDWTVIGGETLHSNNRLYVLCRCVCGTEREVLKQNLKNGNSTNCGCILYENNRKRCTKHGLSHLREYNSWVAMRYRCDIPTDHAYKNYGGRGIKVCPEWQDFLTFYKDMGDCPYPRGQIERRDNNSGYSPSNCFWADAKTQANNKRTNQNITYNGETHTVAQWSEITGIRYITLHKRLFERGWPIDKAITEPSKPGRRDLWQTGQV